MEELSSYEVVKESASQDTWHVKNLGLMMIDKDLILDPSYQRKDVWGEKEKSLLIQSLYMGMSIDPLCFRRLGDKLEVIDGKQRINAIYEYVFDPTGEGFALSGLTLFPHLNGKKYTELSAEDQARIKWARLFVVIYPQLSDSMTHVIFHLMNASGAKLNPQENRNGRFCGKTNDLIKKLATNEAFLKCTGMHDHPKKTKRMQDYAAVLRWMAFSYQNIDHYHGGMKKYLDSFMENNLNPRDEWLADVEETFCDTMRLCYDLLGVYAFCSDKGQFLVNLFQPVAVLLGAKALPFAEQLRAQSDYIRDSFRKLRRSGELSQYLKAHTSDEFAIDGAMRIVREWMEDILDNHQLQARQFPSYIKKELFEDNNACAICKQKIHHIEDAHLDHIIPFSLGGKTERENCQLVHSQCNLKKGNRYDRKAKAA